MKHRFVACATLAATLALGATTAAFAQIYETTKLVPGSAFHGVHGLGIDKSGRHDEQRTRTLQAQG